MRVSRRHGVNLLSLLDLMPFESWRLRLTLSSLRARIEAEGQELVVAGATAVTPVDVASPTFAALMEYHAYRHRAGPPPGTLGQPSFVRVR